MGHFPTDPNLWPEIIHKIIMMPYLMKTGNIPEMAPKNVFSNVSTLSEIHSELVSNKMHCVISWANGQPPPTPLKPHSHSQTVPKFWAETTRMRHLGSTLPVGWVNPRLHWCTRDPFFLKLKGFTLSCVFWLFFLHFICVFFSLKTPFRSKVGIACGYASFAAARITAMEGQADGGHATVAEGGEGTLCSLPLVPPSAFGLARKILVNIVFFSVCFEMSFLWHSNIWIRGNGDWRLCCRAHKHTPTRTQTLFLAPETNEPNKIFAIFFAPAPNLFFFVCSKENPLVFYIVSQTHPLTNPPTHPPTFFSFRNFGRCRGLMTSFGIGMCPVGVSRRFQINHCIFINL